MAWIVSARVFDISGPSNTSSAAWRWVMQRRWLFGHTGVGLDEDACRIVLPTG